MIKYCGLVLWRSFLHVVVALPKYFQNVTVVGHFWVIFHLKRLSVVTSGKKHGLIQKLITEAMLGFYRLFGSFREWIQIVYACRILIIKTGF
jgi:hypothetical protein